MNVRWNILWLVALLAGCGGVAGQGGPLLPRPVFPNFPDVPQPDRFPVRPLPPGRPGPIIFPTPPRSLACTLRGTSTKGTCKPVNECLPVLQNYKEVPPTFCFARGRNLYVCCPSGSSPVSDVSPPIVSFSCGTTSKNPFTFLVAQSFAVSRLERPDLKPSVTEVLNRQPVLEGPSFSPAPTTRFARSPASRGPFTSSLDVRELLPTRDFSRLPVPKRPENILVPTVVNGVDAYQNSWPWMALLGDKQGSSTSWFCDGVLINEQWILTAAHCVILKSANVVRLGEHDLSRTGESAHRDYGVSKVEFHPGYEYPQGYQDLALIQLNRKVSIRNEVRPVCLPWGNHPQPSIGNLLTLTGWGKTSFGGTRSNILQEASLYLLSRSTCVRGYSGLPDYGQKYPKGITPDLLCIGDTDGQGQDACQGDSGGPVVHRSGNRYILSGIVSKGYGCGNPDFPGLYASVHHGPDLAWIKRVAF